jgi:hypothetical protein
MLGLLQGFKFLIFLMEGIGDVFMDLKTGLFSAILGVSMLASSAFGVDYSTMSIEELSKMRGTMQNATIEEKTHFRILRDSAGIPAWAGWRR